MKNQETFDVYYDELGDFLEISFGLPPETEYTEDIESDVFVTRDRKTSEIGGHDDYVRRWYFQSGAGYYYYRRSLASGFGVS